MSLKLAIRDIHPDIDGEYPVDMEMFIASLKHKDLRQIKRMSGVRAGELQEALAAGDDDVMVALAAVLLEREGKTVNEQLLWDAEMNQLLFEQDGVADAVPPVRPLAVAPNGSEPSGEASSPTGEQTPETSMPSSSGDPGSAISADSGRETFFSLLQAS